MTTIAQFLLLLATLCVAAETNPPNAMLVASREKRWKEDLDYFARELPARHIDFFKLISRRSFEKQVAELKRPVARQSDAEIILRLMRMTASLGVSHTRIRWPEDALAFSWYPVYLHWFSDGLAVIAAAPEYREAVGARVLQVGSHTPEQAETAVAAFISHENEAALRSESPMFMRNAALLKFLEMTDADGQVHLQVRKSDGQVATLEITPTPATTQTNWIRIQDALSVPTVLARRRPREFYWFDYLTNSRTLYVQYNVCAQSPKRHFTSFVADLFAFVEAHPVVRMVVDLRYNGGGNSEVIKPLVDGLKARPALSKQGRLYTLIGRNTASSGMMAALEFKNALNAILVGEPTGGKPNAYGDVRTFQLPHSKLRVQYATKLFRRAKHGDPPSVIPDIHVSVSLDDFLAGRDPVLEAVLNQAL